MNTLHFVATGDKDNSYTCILNGDIVDECDINSITRVTQAHFVIANAAKTLGDQYIEITFDDTKAIHPRDYYTNTLLIDMAMFFIHKGLGSYYYQPAPKE